MINLIALEADVVQYLHYQNVEQRGPLNRHGGSRFTHDHRNEISLIQR